MAKSARPVLTLRKALDLAHERGDADTVSFIARALVRAAMERPEEVSEQLARYDERLEPYAARVCRLSIAAARACELSRSKRCKCRCGGRHHGQNRTSEHDPRLCLLPDELHELAYYGWQ